MPHVLIVDQDVTHTQDLTLLLSEDGYEVSVTASPSKAWALLNANVYDLVILEVELPEMSGLGLCRKIRTASTIPIIFVSAYADVKDRVAGLRAGADDYIVKPIEPTELLARVWAALRRAQQHPSSKHVLPAPDLILDLVGNTVTVVRTGVTVELTATEARLLHSLIKKPGLAMTRDALLIQVWGYEYEIANNQLDVYMSRLRGKIEDDPREPRLLVTVRGVGYKYQPQDEERSGEKCGPQA